MVGVALGRAQCASLLRPACRDGAFAGVGVEKTARGHARLRTSRFRRWGLALCGLALAIGLCRPDAPARADDVDITTDTNNGIVLDGFAGTTAKVFPGVTVSNTTFNFNCPSPPPPGAMSLAAVCATTHAWTLTNNGTIGPADFGTGVMFNAGGAIINAGSLSGDRAIVIEGGASASVDNKLGATIDSPGCCGGIVIGESSGVAGTVTNAGTITSASQSISLWGGGTVTNLATGIIMSTGDSNAVSVILGTSRTVINSGLIQSNDTGFATGVALQNGVLTNNAGGQILGALTGVWANGSNPTSIDNAGLIEASQATTLFGVIGSGIEVDGGGSVINSGTIRSTSTDGSDAGIWFTGAGSITNSGTILSTSGGLAILFDGAATHTLNLDTGSVLGGNVQGGTGTDNLVLMGTGSEDIGKFLSFETLSMQGTHWTLTGTGAFTTSATVQSGLLSVNGILTTPSLTVDAGGTLGGTGTVVGPTTVTGTIAPGNSIGTLNITGTYTQAAGSTYTAEVNTTTSDLINVIGAATIQGGTTVSVLAAPGLYTVGHRYTILTASAGVTGTYTTLTDNAPFVDFQLAYDLNNVYLDVIMSSVSFQQVAQTPNQFAAAGGITSLGAGNPVFDAVLPLSADQARHAFDLLSGEIHASILTMLLEQSRFIRDSIGGRLRQFVGGPAALFAPQIATRELGGETALAYADGGRKRAPGAIERALASAPRASFTAWAQSFGNWGHSASDGNAGALDRTNGGFLTGIDKTVADAGGGLWRFGLAGGYQRTTLNVDDRASSGSIDSYDLAAYAGTQQGPLGLRSGAAYEWHDVATSRSIAFPGFTDATQASYGGHTVQVFGEAGYGMNWWQVALEPFAQLAYVDVRTDTFTESGGAATLAGVAGHADATFSTLGLRAAMPLPGMPRLTVKASAGWRHAFGTITPTAQLAFAAGGTPFTVAGLPVAKDAAEVELGIGGEIVPNGELSVAYVGQLAGHTQDNGIKGSFVLRF